MSNRALTAVFQHSKSKGGARLVLLAMADEANDQGLLTAYRRSQSWIAAKANVDKGTVRRSIDALEQLGEIVVLQQGDGRESSDYQLVLPDLADVEGVQDARPARASRTPRAGTPPVQGVQDADPIIPVSPGDPPSDPTSSVDDADTSIVELCDLLADRVHALRGGVDRPAVTGRWCRDMRLLVERGPLGVDKPESMTVENVRRAIEYTFDELAEPGADGFCWARQVQSPHALRKHLPKLREAARRASVGRVGRGAQAVDRVAHRLARDGAESTQRQPLGLLAEHEPKEITG